MKCALGSQLALLAVLGLSSLWPSYPAQAIQFDQTEVTDPARLVVMASPIGTTGSYKLLIFEQLKDTRQCWREVGANPTTIEPLFLEFDFTGICGRSTDSNAYSVRAAGQDLGGRYNLRLARKQNELVLLAFSLTDKNAQFFEIGRTQGLAEGFMKVQLDPGWRLTRRTYEGKTVGHLYFTSDRSLPELANSATPYTPPATPQPSQAPTVEAIPSTPQPSQAPTVEAIPSTPYPPEPISPQPLQTPQPLQPPTVDWKPGNGQPLPSPPVLVFPPIEAQPSQSTTIPSETAPVENQEQPFLAPVNAPPSSLQNIVVPTSPVIPAETPAPLPYYQAPAPQTQGSNQSPPAIATGGSKTAQPSNNSFQTGYRVVVFATTPSQQQQVKQIAPSAFRTTLNGKTVLQVGIFRDRATAESIQKQLAARKLTVQILPTTIPTSTIPSPQPRASISTGASPVTNLQNNAFNLPQPNRTALTRPQSFWATYYYTHQAENALSGYPLLDPAGNSLGVLLSHKDWCAAALEGSVQITDNQQVLGTYNFAGRGEDPQVDCTPFYPTLKTLEATNRVRFKRSNSLYGEGTGSNSLVPYRTIAVDKTRIPIGSVVYIPEARGITVTLPSGQQAVHDGYFYAADVGAAVKENHIDVFLGIAQRNPFPFVRSTSKSAFTAYVINNPQIQAMLASQHQLNRVATR